MQDPLQEDLNEIYAFAIDLGRKAGQLLLGNVEKRIAGTVDQEFEEKENAVDIVTQTDEGLSSSPWGMATVWVVQADSGRG